ncbi:MAG: HypC/HybG/HupF family hydrogenase formation chaperone [Acidimicrobiia bacterium]|nr:HypC/HybG/HupF family hydrogenase formation chaperone [Acidimicrobiia bacterium]
MCVPRIGVVESIDGDEVGLHGLVRFAQTVRCVNLACLPAVAVGDRVAVHAGVGLFVLTADEAAEREALARDLQSRW